MSTKRKMQLCSTFGLQKEGPSSHSDVADWTRCILCQEATGDNKLRCPGATKIPYLQFHDIYFVTIQKMSPSSDSSLASCLYIMVKLKSNDHQSQYIIPHTKHLSSMAYSSNPHQLERWPCQGLAVQLGQPSGGLAFQGRPLLPHDHALLSPLQPQSGYQSLEGIKVSHAAC